ncbi:MAG: ABC transporter substrate-binding protein [Actinobacteria bacterium]|nr:ABC transporter substrate-binding protein [Actinomycetota bacterium]
MRSNVMRVLVVLVAAVGLVASACGGSESSDKTTTTAAGGGSSSRGNVDAQLVMGALVPQTGDLSAIAKSLQTPIEMAVASINEAGGVNGKQVKLVVADDGTNPNVAATSYAKLINTDKADLIIGPAPSGVAAKMLDSFKADKVPACSGSTTAANLKDGGGGYFFRTAPGDDLQGPALATLITNDGHKKVAILARNDDYGKGFSESLKTALTDGGAKVTTTVLYNPDASNFDADVQKALDSSPDAVAVIGFNDDGAKVVNTLIGKGEGPSKMPTYTADGMQSNSFAKTVDAADLTKVAGIKGTAPASAPKGIQSPFTAEFAKTGIDTIFSSYYWDCTNLMALAAVKAKSDDGTKIAEAFAKNLEGDNDCNTFKDCKALLDEGKSIHYRGASSAFDKWNKMQPGTGVYDVWQYTPDGKYANIPGVQQISVG